MDKKQFSISDLLKVVSIAVLGYLSRVFDLVDLGIGRY